MANISLCFAALVLATIDVVQSRVSVLPLRPGQLKTTASSLKVSPAQDSYPSPKIQLCPHITSGHIYASPLTFCPSKMHLTSAGALPHTKSSHRTMSYLTPPSQGSKRVHNY
ncbi:hypothetical protein NA56DRAFT_319354 [Hyaloscypha hepaticicola]|uniref:Secreted protein n=1 Tax=Hyaloscypha hepaticicola TaxID=2082293 RepID=A0A2J6PQE6_9HELO|nr:hypothetical protein NA56DRAFT_319354 [Hyaloscypha hepaticicola]